MYVKAQQSTRNEAANYADNALRGKSYDLDVAGNKPHGAGKLNCSELVGRAYQAAGIELDANGGPGVYPNNLKDDGQHPIFTHERKQHKTLTDATTTELTKSTLKMTNNLPSNSNTCEDSEAESSINYMPKQIHPGTTNTLSESSSRLDLKTMAMTVRMSGR